MSCRRTCAPASSSTPAARCSPDRPPSPTPARALLAAAGDAAELEAVTADGVVCAVRSAHHAAVAVCGRFALPAVTRQDLRVAVAALHDGPPAAAVAVVPRRPPIRRSSGPPRP